jgi:hypothetical protein
MLREGGLCDLLEPDSGAAQRVEAFCNAVAAAILIPASSFLDNEVVGPTGEREWEDDDRDCWQSGLAVWMSRRMIIGSWNERPSSTTPSTRGAPVRWRSRHE